MTLSLFNKNLITRFGQNLPQALLLVGQEHTHALDLIQPIITHFLCNANNCGTCNTCLLIQKKTHPDILYITPEKPGAAIKIDQIRKLQYEAYQTPLCADHRIIIIHPANEMNRAASNALLKVLEEPPKHLRFILIATHLDSLPNTIMSRCQSYQIPEPEALTNPSTPGYLSIGLHYDETTPRGILFKKQQDIISKLCDLSNNKASVCQLAADWSTHALSDWLWFFQLLTATLLQHQLIPDQPVLLNLHLQQLANHYSSVHCFNQLDIILKFTKKINLDIPLNPTLALETLLMGYTSYDSVTG